MATDEQQFFQLLECLMSLDNSVRQQAEVKTKKSRKSFYFNLSLFFKHTTKTNRLLMALYSLTTKLSIW
jgi:hypothetical protein